MRGDSDGKARGAPLGRTARTRWPEHHAVEPLGGMARRLSLPRPPHSEVGRRRSRATVATNGTFTGPSVRNARTASIGHHDRGQHQREAARVRLFASRSGESSNAPRARAAKVSTAARLGWVLTALQHQRLSCSDRAPATSPQGWPKRTDLRTGVPMFCRVSFAGRHHAGPGNSYGPADGCKNNGAGECAASAARYPRFHRII